MRKGEAQELTWADVDVERNTIRVTPEKGSNPRIFKISTKLVQMLKALPKTGDKVFPASCNAINLHQQRKRIARKLQNPRLLQIHFHTLRHWKATMLYHQTKDILYVMKFLGHKSIETTLIYIQLENVLFQQSDEWTVKVAENVDDAVRLLEAGFEYVTDMDDKKLFRKRN